MLVKIIAICYLLCMIATAIARWRQSSAIREIRDLIKQRGAGQ